MGFYSKHIFPFLMDWFCRSREIGEYRRELLKGIRGKILEIGFGTGLNLMHYPKTVKALTALEPNEGMGKKAKKRLDRSPIKVGCYPGRAEKLPFENQTFDSVAVTFTLCSVQDVELTLWEVHRVLKPGGKFFFLEHGLSSDPKVQKKQKRWTPWQVRFADGCHLDRDFSQLITGADLNLTEIKKFYHPGVPKVLGYFYLGVATKST